MIKGFDAFVKMLGVSAALFMVNPVLAADEEDAGVGEILFKIHDVIPEKNADGKVLHCNIGATFFNRTNVDIANMSITLRWEDEVVSDMIDLEEREDKEKRRVAPRAARSRYSTASFNSKTIDLNVKLPPIKSMQQISMKTQVDTDRCFLLLNDMEVTVNNCGTLAVSGKAGKDQCANIFQYVSPKMPEYYTEFKETSYDKQIIIEDEEMANMRKEVDKMIADASATIESITTKENKSEAVEGKAENSETPENEGK